MTAPVSDWRLSTPDGIPYKLIKMEGESGYAASRVTATVMIEADKIFNFLAELFPPAEFIGGVIIPVNGFQIGNIPLLAERVTFRSQTDGLPIDPFESDTGADSNTYYPYLEMDVEYTNDFQFGDPNDPATFLQVSSNSTGEVLTIPGEGKMRWVPDTATGTGNLIPNEDPSIAAVRPVPTREWSFKWPRLNYNYFYNVLKPRLDFAEGKVNSSVLSVLPNAGPGTVLLSGFSHSEEFSGVNQFLEVFNPFFPVPIFPIGSSPITVDLTIKMIEKNFIWNGRVRGHNDFWHAGFGWQRLLIDGTNTAFEYANLNDVFAVQSGFPVPIITPPIPFLGLP